MLGFIKNEMPGQAGHDERDLFHFPLLQHPLILFLSTAAFAATLGSEEGRIYSAFKTAKAFLMSSKLMVPPHMRWTYSGVMPARSIEQERISFSINCRRRATNSSFTVLFIILRCIYGCIRPVICNTYFTPRYPPVQWARRGRLSLP